MDIESLLWKDVFISHSLSPSFSEKFLYRFFEIEKDYIDKRTIKSASVRINQDWEKEFRIWLSWNIADYWLDNVCFSEEECIEKSKRIKKEKILKIKAEAERLLRELEE